MTHPIEQGSRLSDVEIAEELVFAKVPTIKEKVHFSEVRTLCRAIESRLLSKSTETARLREALALAIRQNSHDMLLTGEEIRQCEDALAARTALQASTSEQPETGGEPRLFDVVRRARHLCPSLLPHLDGLRWQARYIEENMPALAPPHPAQEAKDAERRSPAEGTAAAYLHDLVSAMDSAFISSWQTTAGWQQQLDAAREYLAMKDQS